METHNNDPYSLNGTTITICVITLIAAISIRRTPIIFISRPGTYLANRSLSWIESSSILVYLLPVCSSSSVLERDKGDAH